MTITSVTSNSTSGTFANAPNEINSAIFNTFSVSAQDTKPRAEVQYTELQNEQESKKLKGYKIDSKEINENKKLCIQNFNEFEAIFKSEISDDKDKLSLLSLYEQIKSLIDANNIKDIESLLTKNVTKKYFIDVLKNVMLYTILKDNIEIVKLFVKNGLSPSYVMPKIKSPAIFAIACNHKDNNEMAKFLIEKENIYNEDYVHQQIEVATKTDNLEIVKILCDRGYLLEDIQSNKIVKQEINSEFNEFFSLVSKCTELNKTEIVKYLHSLINNDTYISHLEKLVNLTIKNNNSELMEFFLVQYFDTLEVPITIITSNKVSLYNAIVYGFETNNLKLVEYLKEKKIFDAQFLSTSKELYKIIQEDEKQEKIILKWLAGNYPNIDDLVVGFNIVPQFIKDAVVGDDPRIIYKIINLWLTPRAKKSVVFDCCLSLCINYEKGSLPEIKKLNIAMLLLKKGANFIPRIHAYSYNDYISSEISKLNLFCKYLINNAYYKDMIDCITIILHNNITDTLRDNIIKYLKEYDAYKNLTMPPEKQYNSIELVMYISEIMMQKYVESQVNYLMNIAVNKIIKDEKFLNYVIDSKAIPKMTKKFITAKLLFSLAKIDPVCHQHCNNWITKNDNFKLLR